MDGDIPPSRPCRVRRPSSSSYMISSTTSNFPTPNPPNSLAHHSRNRLNIQHHGDIDDDIQPSSSSFTPPSPRPTRQNSSNAPSSSSRNSGDPDSTFWGGPAPSPINNYAGPATPGGLCVVSSSGDIDDVSTMDDINDNDGVSNSNIIMLPCSVSSGSSSSSNNNNVVGPTHTTNNNNNGLILSNSINLNHNQVHSMEPTASSSTSSNLSHSNQSNDLSFSLLPLRSKIKKASSFERFSLQAASNSMSSSSTSSSASVSNITTSNHQNINNSNNNNNNDLSVNQQQHDQHQDLSSSVGSRLLWDSIQSSSSAASSSSSSASSTLRQIFTTNSSGMSGESKSLHIKIPSKKLAAKIAIEQQQMQQALQQQNAMSAMNMNLINESQSSSGVVVENLNSNNNNGGGSSNLMSDAAMVTAERLIRELSESPLNLTESHNHSTHEQSNHSANSQMRRNFMTTTTVTTTTAMALPIPSKKILTPKQKMLHRVQSGEILQPQQSMSSSSSSSSSIGLNSFQQQQQQQQQNLSSLVSADNLEQQVHSPPPQLQPPLDVYSYEPLPRDDFVVVQDSLSSLSKVDGDPNNVSVLYDPDAYSYYYGNMLGDEIFSTTTSSTSSSRGPLFMVPASMALQDAVDLQGQHVEFILGMDEGHEHDNVDGGRGREDGLDGGAQFDPNEGHSSSLKSQSQADSTLRNLLMMEPIRTHDDSWIAAGYQSRLLTSRSIGGGGLNNNNSGSGNNSGNMNCAQIQNSSINAALNMNNLNNSWMNLNVSNVNSWTHSMGMGMNLAQQGDEQDEVMDMSVIETSDKHGGKRGHVVVHDLVGDMQIPMDLQQPLDLIGSTQNKGGQLLIHDNGGGGSMDDPDGNNPINLQQHHRCDDDEPVNLMSAVNLENDISQYHHHHHYHPSSSSRQQQQMMQTDSNDDGDHLPLLSNNVLQKQSSTSVIHSRHLGHALDNSQLSCGGYITLHGSSQSQSSSSTGNLSNDQQQQLHDPNVDPSPSDHSVITINGNNNDDHEGNLDNIDERRIIRVKKKDLNLINISNSASGSLALSPGGSMGTDGTLTLSKTPMSTAAATFILDKPVVAKSFASLPTPLTLIRLTGNGWAVFTARCKTIAVNTRFGPVEGPLKKAEDLSNKNAVYPCLVMLDNTNNLWQLDRHDDELCNWMKFVRLARSTSEQNAVISEDRGLLYFCTTKEIPPKTELQVGYSYEYAQKYGLDQKYVDDDEEVVGNGHGTQHETDCDLLDQEQDCRENHNKQILDDSTQRDKVSLSLQNDHHDSSISMNSNSKSRVVVEEEEIFSCFECESEFPSVEQLNIHLDTEHSEPDVVVVRSSRNNRKPKRKFLKKALKCSTLPSTISTTTSSSTMIENSTAKTNNNLNNNSDNQSNNISHTMSPNNSDEFDNNYVNNNNTTVNNHVVEIGDNDEPAIVVSTGVEEGVKRGKYECQSCGQSVPTLVDLKKHAEEHYEGIFLDNGTARPLKIQNKKPNSEVVGSSMETDSLKNQMKNLGDGTNNKQEGGVAKVKCTMCYKSFKSKERLERHMIVHSDDNQKPLKCQLCSKRYLTNSAIAAHMKTHLGKCFECPMCSFVTQQLLQLKEHVQTHKNKENGLFHCPRCSKKFSIYSMVRKHIRAFHGTKQFSCDQCTMSFPTSDKLKLHKLKHSDHREFLCAECGRQFKRKDKLREHMKRMHENRKKVLEIQELHGSLGSKNRNSKKFMPKVSPEEFEKFVYKCADCMMGFKRRGMLVNHLAKRHPEKPPQQVPELNLPILRPTRNYFCPYCEKTYKSSSKRKSHILKAHPGKAVPPQLKGKEILTMTLNDKFENTNAPERVVVHSSGQGNASGKIKESTVSLSSLSSSDKNNDHVDGSVKQYTEVAVVGTKVMTDFHSCQWCHRQYATRAKLLQHQRKSHLHLMPADMQLPRTQKNNVLRSTADLSNLPTSSASNTNGMTEVIVEVERISHRELNSDSYKTQNGTDVRDSITVAFTPDSSTQIGNSNSISSSTTVGGEGGQQHQLQQIHITAEEGNVIGFLLTTTVNGDTLDGSEIVLVPNHLQQGSQLISSATANAIQQAVLGQQQNSGTTTNNINQNILSNVISSAVAGINI